MAVTGAEAQISDAILDFAEELAGDLDYDIAMPNAVFTPPQRKGFLKAEYMPNISERRGLAFDSDVNYEGLLTVSVFWPSETGIILPMQVASSIVEAFTPGTRINKNDVTVFFDRQPSVRPSVQESDWVQIPIVIYWRACHHVVA